VPATDPAPVEVVAGALIDADGRVLIAERPPGKAFAGRWEFPGGKLRAGEAPRDGLRRELLEELGVEPGRCAPLLSVTHHYPRAPAVRIDCWRVETWRGEPAALDGQRLRWCTRAELAAADILEADRAIVTALLLPPLLVRVAAGRAPPAASGPRGRTGWLLDAHPGAAAWLGPDDLVVLVDPATPPDDDCAAVYRTRARFARSRRRTAPAGQRVGSAAEARAALAAGADFLLVSARGRAQAELTGIAAAGLPWYLDVTQPGIDAGIAPTGRLWWPRDAHD
jgi:mutator protein MutT